MTNFVSWFLDQAMLQEALQQAGAAQYERTDAWKAHRNDYNVNGGVTLCTFGGLKVYTC